MISDSDLAAMEARARDATEGPWVAEVFDSLGEAKSEGHFGWAISLPGRVAMVWKEVEGGTTGLPGSIEVLEHDGDFIAHARTDVPALIAEVRRLRAEVEAIKPHIDLPHPKTV